MVSLWGVALWGGFSMGVTLWRGHSMEGSLYGVVALWRGRSMGWSLYGVVILWGVTLCLPVSKWVDKKPGEGFWVWAAGTGQGEWL